MHWRKLVEFCMVAEHWLLLQLNWSNGADRRRRNTGWQQQTATAWQVQWQDGTVGRVELVTEDLCSTVQDWSCRSDGISWDCTESNHWWTAWENGERHCTFCRYWVSEIQSSTALPTCTTDHRQCQTSCTRKLRTEWFWNMALTGFEIFTATNCTGYQFTDKGTGIQIPHWPLWTRLQWMGNTES